MDAFKEKYGNQMAKPLHSDTMKVAGMEMKKEIGYIKEGGSAGNIVVLIFAIAGSIFMVIAAAVAHRMACVYYLIVFVVIMLIGWPKRESVPFDQLGAHRE